MNRLHQLLALTAYPSADVALGKETQGVLLVFFRIYLVFWGQGCSLLSFFSISMDPISDFTLHNSEALPRGIASTFR